MEYAPFYLTFKLAISTTVLLFILMVPLAYILAYSKWKIKYLFESAFMLPIILPPTVLGYYYLSMLGPSSGIGAFFHNTLGFDLAFTFQGVLIGSMIYCLPFMLNPLISGFRSVPRNLIESAQLMGKSRLNILWNVQLPQIKNFIWNALLLTFAHTIGEFGVVLMIGGNLPDTKVASIAIYDEMNQLNFENANTYALILLGFSFLFIMLLTLVMRKNKSTFA
jgi:molybdate transport system permease protein